MIRIIIMIIIIVIILMIIIIIIIIVKSIPLYYVGKACFVPVYVFNEHIKASENIPPQRREVIISGNGIVLPSRCSSEE